MKYNANPKKVGCLCNFTFFLWYFRIGTPVVITVDLTNTTDGFTMHSLTVDGTYGKAETHLLQSAMLSYVSDL